ncbi:hypothetical protein N483_07910 [Pseudoalteromonas luteoviolacea NCIMB 1944]|uniref:Uncharacterized protein n=1 Tax=Pseudoalteromonas luteoviolacea (strain 2ta16) TaxID=1353533 RepID=V4HR22_PSEL2|nr:hypothetical protein PL2TA16_05080 [Pseudoalteromonas luteoviolacea 2ta16]KZN29352.1 hypothetical protein N483_07910 [Pseudoalteromonas luteoviolacea NCIMB 1944]
MCPNFKSLEAQWFFEFHVTLFAVLAFFAMIILPALRILLHCYTKKENLHSFITLFTTRVVSNSKLEVFALLVLFFYFIYFFSVFIFKFCMQ